MEPEPLATAYVCLPRRWSPPACVAWHDSPPGLWAPSARCCWRSSSSSTIWLGQPRGLLAPSPRHLTGDGLSHHCRDVTDHPSPVHALVSRAVLGVSAAGEATPLGVGWFMGRWFRSARIVTFLCVQVQAVVMPACKCGTDGQPFPPIALDPVPNHVGVVAPSARWPERRVHRWACL